MLSFKDSLKNIRLERGISQSKLATVLNVSLKTISHWETGYTEPSLNQLISIADYFELTLDELVGREYK